MAKFWVNFEDRKVHHGKTAPGDGYIMVGDFQGFNGRFVPNTKYIDKSSVTLTETQVGAIIEKLSTILDNHRTSSGETFRANFLGEPFGEKYRYGGETIGYALFSNFIVPAIKGRLKVAGTEMFEKYYKAVASKIAWRDMEKDVILELVESILRKFVR